MRTLTNMVDRLGDRYDFRIITRDRDGVAAKEPYSTVRIGEWNRVGNAQVYYLPPGQIRLRSVAKVVNSISADIFYLNSFFGRLSIIFKTLRKLNQVPARPLILAPEGEFSVGALTLKPIRKLLYIKYAKSLRLLSNVVWKAASELERAEIEDALGFGLQIYLAPNMPPRMINGDYEQDNKSLKIRGRGRFVFLSRFMQKKNLNWLLPHLKSITGELSLSIYGTIEDASYWLESVRTINELPPNITVEARGPIAHAEVSKTLESYEFFILPTLGENFGHVFVEALASGCPLVISDRTPWRQLEKSGIGWDIPLNEEDWVAVLNKCVAMNNDEYQHMSTAARSFAVSWLCDPSVESANVRVLNIALGELS